MNRKINRKMNKKENWRLKGKAKFKYKLPRLCAGCLREGNGLNTSQFALIAPRPFEKLRKSRYTHQIEVNFYMCERCRAKSIKIHKIYLIILSTFIILAIMGGYLNYFHSNLHILAKMALIYGDIILIEILGALSVIQLRLLRHPSQEYLKVNVPHLPYYVIKRSRSKIPVYIKIKTPKVLLAFKSQNKKNSDLIAYSPMKMGDCY